jgi:hypothetical protein
MTRNEESLISLLSVITQNGSHQVSAIRIWALFQKQTSDVPTELATSLAKEAINIHTLLSLKNKLILKRRESLHDHLNDLKRSSFSLIARNEVFYK